VRFPAELGLPGFRTDLRNAGWSTNAPPCTRARAADGRSGMIWHSYALCRRPTK